VSYNIDFLLFIFRLQNYLKKTNHTNNKAEISTFLVDISA